MFLYFVTFLCSLSYFFLICFIFSHGKNSSTLTKIPTSKLSSHLPERPKSTCSADRKAFIDLNYFPTRSSSAGLRDSLREQPVSKVRRRNVHAVLLLALCYFYLQLIKRVMLLPFSAKHLGFFIH